jgi:hypothetical protein
MNADRVRAVWEIELDRLEVDVVRAERLVKGLEALPADPWDPPAVPGRMPFDLAVRARDLLDRQERAIESLRESLASAQRQLAYAARISGAVSPLTSVPVYLDLEA